MSFSGTKGYITKPKPGIMLNPLHPLSKGLIGYWLFNEGAGSRACDISGKGNHGTLKNMSPNAQGSGWGSSSKFGGGLEFDGVDDYVPFSDITLSKKFSFYIWAKKNELSSNGGLLGWTDLGGVRYFNINGNYARGETNTNLQYFNFTDPTITDTNFHHYCVVFDNGNYFCYLDGDLNNSGSASGDLTLNQIGRGKSINFFNGSIDSVCFYSRSLLDAEIKQLYHDPFCNLLQVPIRRYFEVTPPIGVAPTAVFYGPLVGPLGGPI